MIKRKIHSRLSDFYAKNNKALLLAGARQTGKSYSIRHFGQTNFKYFVEINFIEQPAARDIFRNAGSAEDILLRLTATTSQIIQPGETLFFFDEVQVCPEAVTAIKFLVADGRYRYIMSGSLLGIELTDLRSAPVGYMDIWQMYPLDLEEFYLALGVQPKILDTLRTCWEERKPVDKVVHEKMMQVFRLYLLVGGMPAVVQKYLDTKNLQEVLQEQQSIVRLYHIDIAKYDPDNKLYIREIFRLIPPELNAKNKRFILKSLNEHLKFSRYENSFLWLRDAGVALPVYCVDEPTIPLLLSRSRNLFKLFMSDVGLLASSFTDGNQLRILNDEPNINFGAIYENAVAQELQSHGFDLYYFNSKKQGELDFVIERQGKCLPIEVKSGKDYQRHNALSRVMEDANYGISSALVLSGGNLSQSGDILYAPIYMLMFLNKGSDAPIIYNIDL